MGEHRFFVPSSLIKGKKVSITGSDVKHIRNVLRLKKGDKVTILDGEGSTHLAQIAAIGSAQVHLEILKSSSKDLPKRKVSLFQGVPKGAKMDFIVQKATELGVDRIVPVVFERTVPDLREKAAAKQKRWWKIAEEAAKQSERLTIPEVLPPRDFDAATRLLSEYDGILVFWEDESGRLVSDAVVPDLKKLAVVVGPEGGMTLTEVKKMVALGAKTVTFGDFLLRTETAAIAALAIVAYELRRQEEAVAGDRGKPKIPDQKHQASNNIK